MLGDVYRRRWVLQLSLMGIQGNGQKILLTTMHIIVHSDVRGPTGGRASTTLRYVHSFRRLGYGTSPDYTKAAALTRWIPAIYVRTYLFPETYEPYTQSRLISFLVCCCDSRIW